MTVKATRETLDLIRSAAIKRTVLFLLLTGAAFPILYTQVDIPAVTYCKYELAPSIVEVARQTDDFDDYFLIAFFLAGAVAVIVKRSENLVFIQKMFFPLAAVGVSGLTTHVFKTLFGRWRPNGYFVHGEYGFEWFSEFKVVLASFPSGHASSIMTIMTAVVLLNVRPSWRPACYVFAAALACMRVIVCAHYPSDVLAGIVQGYLTTLWLYYFLVMKAWHPAPTGETDCFRMPQRTDRVGVGYPSQS